MTPLADRILERVVMHGTVTFAELDQIEGFSGGDQQLVINGIQFGPVAGTDPGWRRCNRGTSARAIHRADTDDTTGLFLRRLCVGLAAG
jgi:hypothetical protein